MPGVLGALVEASGLMGRAAGTCVAAALMVLVRSPGCNRITTLGRLRADMPETPRRGRGRVVKRCRRAAGTLSIIRLTGETSPFSCTAAHEYGRF